MIAKGRALTRSTGCSRIKEILRVFITSSIRGRVNSINAIAGEKSVAKAGARACVTFFARCTYENVFSSAIVAEK